MRKNPAAGSTRYTASRLWDGNRPYYVDTIIRRFDELYGLKAVHTDSKLDFQKLRSKRSQEKMQWPKNEKT
jgi:hypothetical protein